MAFVYRIGPRSVGFNLDYQEEILLIAGYIEVRGLLTAHSWIKRFEANFFQTDRGVMDQCIAGINYTLGLQNSWHRLRLRLAPTLLTEYMQTTGDRKVATRVHLHNTLQNGGEVANRMVNTARITIPRLPSPLPDVAGAQNELFASVRNFIGDAPQILPREHKPAPPLPAVKPVQPAEHPWDSKYDKAALARATASLMAGRGRSRTGHD